MSKIYLFGIGGTGSRVIKSLTFLLAAGVKCDIKSIIPIIIDPDESGGDVTRTSEFLKKYSSVRSELEQNDSVSNNFFSSEIIETMTNFRLTLKGTRDVKFREYIEEGCLDKDDRALVNLLFSDDNLDSDMKVGFKGNPNIGSVVLNQFEENPEFEKFANSFEDGDRIFIISSIFGGTGASGFPLLLKTLKTSKTIPNHNLINNAMIGAISVLPYFGVTPGGETSKIDSGTFISKTKSALDYYYKNISCTNEISVLYYIADDIRNTYENKEGGEEQENAAHLIELISALSIIDFASLQEQKEGACTIHKEFGIETDAEEIIFTNLAIETRKLIEKPMTQLFLFAKYMKEECDKEYNNQPWAKKLSVDSSYMGSNFVKELKELLEKYIEWLKEMSENKRSFSPFDLTIENGSFGFIKNIPEKKIMSLKSKYSLYNDRLNKHVPLQATNNNHRFVELFYNATEELIKEKYSLN